ncbi:ABC transporter permease [Dysosmobacter sp.]|jgi:hypothetical protein|uniref:ABC transporter permease n=1 Tax=Dysosmobacter sp. TaxID=2591382 RepID=UPI003A95D5DF
MAAKTKTKEKFYLGQHLRKFGAVYAFVILVVVDSLLNKNFLALNTLWNLSIQVLPILLTALGMLLVISTSGIDISTGSLMAVAGVLCAKFITGQIALGNGSIPLAMIMGLLAATLLGAVNGALIAQFKIQPIIVTLVLYIAGRGIAQLMSDGSTLVFYNTPFNDLGVMRLGGQVPLQLLLEIAFVLIFAFLLKKTTFGYYIQAIGENEKAATLSGIQTKSVLVAVYAISGFMAGCAGLMTSARACCADPNSLGALAEMDAIAAVAIGGTSMNGGKARIMGTVFGALIIQLITMTINMNNIHYAYARILKGLIIVIAVYLQREKKR